MKNSGGKTKTVYKLKKRNAVLTCLIFLGVFMITLGGLLTTKSSLIDMLNFTQLGEIVFPRGHFEMSGDIFLIHLFFN